MKVIGFVCDWAVSTEALLDAQGRLHAHPSVHVVRIPCSGFMRPDWLGEALRAGAGGNLVPRRPPSPPPRPCPPPSAPPPRRPQNDPAPHAAAHHALLPALLHSVLSAAPLRRILWPRRGSLVGGRSSCCWPPACWPRAAGGASREGPSQLRRARR